MIPNFISHYHLPDREPFLTLSDLEGDINHPVFVEMLNKHKTATGYNRRFGRNYLEVRSTAESKLKLLFEKRGGVPKRRNPYYFVLGTSDWFRHFNIEHQELRIAIKDLPHDSVSITFPDSFIAMTVKEKSYYEKVYFLDEIESLIAEHGLPKNQRPESYEKYWLGDFEKYIEVQVWDDEVVEPFRKGWKPPHQSQSIAALPHEL